MIPVQVGTRIVDLVSVAQASRISTGVNVKTVRDRRTKSIVRLIIKPHEAGNGRADEQGEHLDSRKTTYREPLFVDHEPDTYMLMPDGAKSPRPARRAAVAGSSFVYQLKPSSSFLLASGRREGTSAPTTTSASTRRPGRKTCRG
jgi:hypothetical protein